MPIRNVSDTARWVAVYRAMESERSDALFHDPYARRLAGERGEAIVRELPLGRSVAWAMVVRTALIDELTLACIADGARTVLNLGAGLDTRAFRLDLPKGLLWIDADLPTIVEQRRRDLDSGTARCQHRHVEADLGDAAARAEVFAMADDGPGPLLVLTEGLLVYLAAAQVDGLARQLSAGSRARWWITDLLSPWVLNTVCALWQPQLRAAGSGLSFAPADSTAFFAACGWTEASYRSIWDESLRLKRPAPFADWFQAVPGWGGFGLPSPLRRMAGVALLERAPPPDQKVPG